MIAAKIKTQNIQTLWPNKRMHKPLFATFDEVYNLPLRLRYMPVNMILPLISGSKKEANTSHYHKHVTSQMTNSQYFKQPLNIQLSQVFNYQRQFITLTKILNEMVNVLPALNEETVVQNLTNHFINNDAHHTTFNNQRTTSPSLNLLLPSRKQQNNDSNIRLLPILQKTVEKITKLQQQKQVDKSVSVELKNYQQTAHIKNVEVNKDSNKNFTQIDHEESNHITVDNKTLVYSPLNLLLPPKSEEPNSSFQQLPLVQKTIEQVEKIVSQQQQKISKAVVSSIEKEERRKVVSVENTKSYKEQIQRNIQHQKEVHFEVLRTSTQSFNQKNLRKLFFQKTTLPTMKLDTSVLQTEKSTMLYLQPIDKSFYLQQNNKSAFIFRNSVSTESKTFFLSKIQQTKLYLRNKQQDFITLESMDKTFVTMEQQYFTQKNNRKQFLSMQTDSLQSMLKRKIINRKSKTSYVQNIVDEMVGEDSIKQITFASATQNYSFILPKSQFTTEESVEKIVHRIHNKIPKVVHESNMEEIEVFVVDQIRKTVKHQLQQNELDVFVDKIYKKISQKIRIEKQRRGLK
ncbi:hypothetical protein [Candidatus Uabimicrobium sp. HlEnr_7]|uniref:hypothetical protein n=1 Tax=Candidatus Uabimicrobium helgolandensis TaxID=3095367 RepID=UPI003557769A